MQHNFSLLLPYQERVKPSPDWQITEFQKLQNNEKSSDFVIMVEGKKFHVHKLILAARSPVFEKMLTHDMKEAREGMVTIADISAEVMEEVIQYMYIGLPPSKIKEKAEDFLIVANKYELSGLRNMCMQELKSRLNINNALQLLVFADQYQVADLKESIMEFILTSENHAKNLLSLPSWKEMEDSHNQLAGEIYKKLVLKFIVNRVNLQEQKNIFSLQHIRSEPMFFS